MTGDSSVMAKSPDQSAISRGSHRISASLMPHGAAYELAYIGAALASILAELPLVAGALTLVLRHARSVRGVRQLRCARRDEHAVDEYGRETGHGYLKSVAESPESRVGTCTPCLHLKDDPSATSLER